MGAEERAREATQTLDIVQSSVEVAEVSVEAVVPLTTVGVLSLVQEAVQAQGKALRVVDKAGLGADGTQPEVVLREDEQLTAVMVRLGHMDVATEVVPEAQDNQELMGVMGVMGVPQAVEEEVPEAKATAAVQAVVLAVMEPEAKLEYIVGR